MNKRGIQKRVNSKSYSLLAVSLLVLLLTLVSANEQYEIGEKIKFDLDGFNDPLIKIDSPEKNIIYNPEGSSFIFVPEIKGEHSITITDSSSSRIFNFDVIEAEPSKEENSTREKMENLDLDFLEEELEFEEDSIKEQKGIVEINKPVVWEKTLNETTLKIPKKAENFEFNASSNIEIKETTIDRIVNIFSENEQKSIIVENPNEEEIITFETPGPKLEVLNENELKKEVRVWSEVHYKNVLAYTTLSNEVLPKDKDRIRVYWKEERRFLPSNSSDSNDNGLIDYIEWNIPHLSNQTFDIIIEIESAIHLDEDGNFLEDILSRVNQKDDIWSPEILNGQRIQIFFEKLLDNSRDITIYARPLSGNPRVEVYEIGENGKIADFGEITNEGFYKVILANLVGRSAGFELLVIGGSILFDWIVDPLVVIYDNANGPNLNLSLWTNLTTAGDETDIIGNGTHIIMDSDDVAELTIHTSGIKEDFEGFRTEAILIDDVGNGRGWSFGLGNSTLHEQGECQSNTGWVPDTGYWVCILGNNNINLYRNDPGGVATSLDSGSFTVVHTSVYEFDLFKNETGVFFFIDEALVLSSTDTTYPDDGYITISTGGGNSNRGRFEINNVWEWDNNLPPSDPIPSLNSTTGLNSTIEDLFCTSTLIDIEADSMNVTSRWYLNGTLTETYEHNSSYSNATEFSATLTSANTSIGDQWICSLELFDGDKYSSWVNTSSISILSAPTAPSVIINSPLSGSTIADTTPILNVTLNDTAGNLYYSINGSSNITICSGCSGIQTINLHEEEGYYLIDFFATTPGSTSSNSTLITLDHDRFYFEDFTDNGQIDFFFNDIRQIFGNLSFFGTPVSPEPLDFSGFESGVQGWTSGGEDSDYSSVRSYCLDDNSLGGSFSWHLQDDTTTSVVNKAFNFTGKDYVNVSWAAYYESIEGTEFLSFQCDGTELWTYEADTLGTENQWLLGSGGGQEIIIYPSNCTFDDSVTLEFEAEFSGNGDEVYIDCINVTGYENPIYSGNLTSKEINTTDTVYEILNITWDEFGTDANNNVTVEISTDFGGSFVTVNESEGQSGTIEGTSIIYRILFQTDGPNQINFTNLNFSWRDTLPPAPIATIYSPLGSIEDITPLLNTSTNETVDTMMYSVNGGPNITLCTSCTSSDNIYLHLEEGIAQNITIWTNSSIGAVQANTSTITVETNNFYFESYVDNSSIDTIFNLTYESSNISFIAPTSNIDYVNEDFETDNGTFTYVTDPYQGTSNPTGSTGNRVIGNALCFSTSSCLEVYQNSIISSDTSGAWNVSFNVTGNPEYVNVSLYYTNFQEAGADSGEFSRFYVRNITDGTEIELDEIEAGSPTSNSGYFSYLAYVPDGEYHFDAGSWADTTSGADEDAGGYIDNVVITGVNAASSANFTAKEVNVTENIVEIENVTWSDSGVSGQNSLTLEFSPNFGSNWYTATKNEGFTGIVPGTSLLYRFLFEANATNRVSLFNFNISWSSIATPPPYIVVNSPLGTIADVTPTLNITINDTANTFWYSINDGTNITICEECSGTYSLYLHQPEGTYDLAVFANNSIGEISTNHSTYVIDLNYEYYDNFDDNSSQDEASSNSISWNTGNISFTGAGSTINLLTENFNDGDATDGSPTTWTTVDDATSGTCVFTVNSGIFTESTNCNSGDRDTTSFGGYAYPGNQTWTDINFTSEVRSTDNDGTGLMFRYVDNDNYYRVRFDGTSNYRRLERIEAGVVTILDFDNLADGGLSEDQWFNVTVTTIGSNIEVFLGGSSVLQATDSTFNNGSIAVYSWGQDSGSFGADFDNIVVDAIGPSIGNYTALEANLSSTIVEFENITWIESATSPGNNITVQVSPNFGANWYTATNGEGIIGIATGSQLMYRVLFSMNDTGTIYFDDINITWTDQTSPPPGITIDEPLPSSIQADVTPRLNITLNDSANTLWYNIDNGANTTICNECTGQRSLFLNLTEGTFTVNVYANNVLGDESSNSSTFTIDMNGNFIDSYNDNSSVTFASFNRVGYNPTNISFDVTEQNRILLQENFDDGDATDGSPTTWFEVANAGGCSWSVQTGIYVESTNCNGGGGTRDTTAPGGYAYPGNQTWTDVNITAELRSTDNDGMGLMFRYINDSNYYRVKFEGTNNYRRIEKIENGVHSILDSDSLVDGGLTEDVWHNVTVTAIGDQFEVFLDGASVMTATDSSFSYGSMAFYSWGQDGTPFGADFDNLLVEDLSPIRGNFTGYPINTTNPIVEILNVTWLESGTTTFDNISVEISVNNGNNWYPATNNSGITGFTAGSSLVYRVNFQSNDSTTIYLDEINITWSDSASPPPSIIINSPVDSSTFPDVTPLLNVTLNETADALFYSINGAPNVTICNSCTGTRTRFVYLTEGDFNIQVFANNSLGTISTNQTDFTVDMNRNFYDSWDDNATLISIFNSEYNPGNISLQSGVDTILLSETFEDTADWTLTGGTWQITSNQLEQAGNANSTTAIYDLINITVGTDLEINMTAFDDDNDETGIIFRYMNSDNYYRCSSNNDAAVNPTGTIIYRVQGGAETTLATSGTTFTENTQGDYRVTVINNNISCYLNDQLLATAVDSTWETGQVGIFNSFHQNALYDDFIVTQTSNLTTGNFTAYEINTTQPITSITNITWDDNGDGGLSIIEVNISVDNGLTWYNTTKNEPVTGIVSPGSSLIFQVFMQTIEGFPLYLNDMNISWAAPPTVTIFYPSNTTYSTQVTTINYTSIPGPGSTLDTCWYSLDGGATNITVSCSANVTSISSTEGLNTWTVWSNDSDATLGRDDVTFTVDTSGPNITLINQTSDDQLIVNDTFPLEEGQNLTITANVTDDNLEYVWLVVWENVIGGAQRLTTFFTYMAGMGLWVAEFATDHTWLSEYNYTIFANDTAGFEINLSSSFPILKIDTTIDLEPTPSAGNENVTIAGEVNFTNGTGLVDHPINIWLDGYLLLLENVSSSNSYNNFRNFTYQNSATFNGGTYVDYVNATDTGENISLSAGATSGNYTRTVDGSAMVEWTNLSWTHVGQACSASLTYQDGLNSFGGTRDTYIDADNANTNYGTSDTLITDSSPVQRSLLYFDAIGPGNGRVPFNSTITAANITLNVFDAGNPVTVYEVLENWEEDEATYNNRLTGGTAWGSTGVAAPPSRSAAITDTFNPVTVGNYTFDITNLFTTWVNQSSTNYGVVLNPGGTNDVNIRSSDYSIQSHRPRLDVAFSATDCTSVLFYVRFSNDNSTWTSWQEVQNGQTPTNPLTASRFMQYRAVLGSVNSTATPYLDDIEVNYTAIVTGPGADYAYNFTSPGTFGTYLMKVNTSYRTIYSQANQTLSVQSGVSPTVILLEPANATWFNFTGFNLTYNATDGNLDIINASLILNGLFNQSNSTNVIDGGFNNFTFNFGSGIYNWTVNVSDSNGNIAINTTQEFYVDLEDPNITLVYPANGSGFALNEVNLSFFVTDNLDSTLSCDIVLDSNTIYSNEAMTNNTQANFSSGTLTAGLHYWNVTCTDEAQRSSTSETWVINITDTPPLTTLLSPVDNQVLSSENVSFVFLPSDNSGFQGCTLYMNETYTYANQSEVLNNENNTINVSFVPEGYHNWTVDCIDLSGSNSTAPVWDFAVDLNSPNVDLNLPANNSILTNADVNFNYTATDVIDSSLFCDLTVDNVIQDSFTATNATLTNRQVENLTDGIHYWNVTCVDDSGYQNTSETRWLTVEEEPSIVLTTANATSFSTSSITLSYVPTDNTGFSQCSVYLNGALNNSNSSAINNGASNDLEIDGLLDGNYLWYINCSDTYGLFNTSEERTFSVDSNPPTVNLLYPDGDNVFSENITINFTASDTIDLSMTCSVSVDGSVVSTGVIAPNGTVTNETLTGITDGFHTYFVNCTDDAGNIGNSNIQNFTKLTEPGVFLVSPPNNTWINTSNFNLTYLPQDDEGIAISYLVINGEINRSNETTINVSQNNNFTLISWPDGIYDWNVIATDITGINGSGSNRTFYVDTTAPIIVMNAPNESELITTNNITFNFTPSDNVDTILECNLTVDGEVEHSNNIASGTEYIYSLPIVDGNHTWSVTCENEVNLTTTTETRNFTVLAPPVVTLNSPPAGNITRSSTLNLSYTPEDVIGITSCTLYFDGVANETDISITPNIVNNFTIDGVAEGAHNWTVNCTDPDGNTAQAANRSIIRDISGPIIALDIPVDGAGLYAEDTNVLFRWTATDTFFTVLTCDLFVDGSVELDDVLVTSGFPYSDNVAGLTAGNHSWNVTCWDGLDNIETSITRYFNRTYPDFEINTTSITFNTTTPAENEQILINATIQNLGGVDISSVIVQFYNGDPDSGGTQIGANQTISISQFSSNVSQIEYTPTIGTNEIWVVADPYIPSNGTYTEFSEENNKANNNISVQSWHFFQGSINDDSEFVLDDESSTSAYRWNESNLSNANIYITDYEAIIDWLDVHAIGKNDIGTNSTNDLVEIDSLLNMTSFNDSVNNTYVGPGLELAPFIVFGYSISEVPIADSINNSNFKTGILWDNSDDSNGEFDETDSEDLIFVTEINNDQLGSFGEIVDYEIRVPANLRTYDSTDSNRAAFYIEIV